MKKTIWLLSATLFLLTNINAQTATPAVKVCLTSTMICQLKKVKILLKVKRSYLGYSYKIDDRFSTKITFDVGSNSGGSAYTAFLKIASLKWKTSDILLLNLGMVGTKNFKFMEKAWGRRYIEKSAQDKYKWASSADVGVTADYKVSDNISIDAQVLNGEGYKKTQSANGLFRGILGLTYISK